MINNHSINFGIDILIHIFILFTFLTIFFFVYIANIEKQNISDLTNNIINDNTTNILNNIDNLSTKFDYTVNWKLLDNIATNLMQTSNKDVPEIKKNNENVFKTSMIILGILFGFILVLILYLKFFTSFDINLKHILLMNLIIFSFTGLIEYIFFTFVATKYVPIMPDTISNSMLDRLKTDLSMEISPQS